MNLTLRIGQYVVAVVEVVGVERGEVNEYAVIVVMMVIMIMIIIMFAAVLM